MAVHLAPPPTRLESLSLPQTRRRLVPLWLVAGALAVLAALPFLPALDSFFLGDDFGLIWLFQQKRIGHFITLFWSPWTENVYGIYADELRPTLAFTYWLDGRLFGSHNPFGFHLDNTLFHIACTLLTWGIARAVVRREAVAATAAALFAVSPIHPEAVTWISGRADLIPTFFYAGGFLAFVRFRQGAGWPMLALACAGYFFALYSKQSGVTFLGMLVAYDLCYGNLPPRGDRHLLFRRLAAYAPFALGLVGYLALRRALFGQSLREDIATVDRVVEWLGRQSFYLQGTFLGGPLDRLVGPEPAPAQWVTLAVVIVVVGAAVGAALVRRRRTGGPGGEAEPALWRHLLFFGAAWYAICVLPLVVTYQSPRHLYCASIGGAIVVAALIWYPWRRPAPARVAVPVAVSLLLVGTFWVRLNVVNEEWLAAGAAAERAAVGISRIAAELPPGSNIVLLAPGSYGPAWFWMWSLPYATDRPFATGDLYGRHHVVEAPATYCCPLAQWWRERRPIIRGWLEADETVTLTTVAWNGPAGAFDVVPRPLPTAVLRERMAEVFGGPLTDTTEATEEQINHVLRILIDS